MEGVTVNWVLKEVYGSYIPKEVVVQNVLKEEFEPQFMEGVTVNWV